MEQQLNATYTIENTKITDSKYYYCEITSTVDGKKEIKKSQIVQLTVIIKISNSTIPNDLEVNTGETIQITAETENNAGGDITYQWYKTESDEAKDGTPVDGATSSTLQILNSDADDSGKE